MSEQAFEDVLVAEPHELVKLGIHHMVERSKFGRHVHSVETWCEAAEVIYQHRPAVLLASTELDGEPNEALYQFIEREEITVVLLVRTPDRRRLCAFLRLPIAAALHEEDLSVASLSHLSDLLGHGSPGVHRHTTRHLLALATSDVSSASGSQPNLTPREMDTLRALADGLTNRQVARRLGISEHGVKRHVASLLAKLHAVNRTMAVTSAIERGLLAHSAYDS